MMHLMSSVELDTETRQAGGTPWLRARMAVCRLKTGSDGHLVLGSDDDRYCSLPVNCPERFVGAGHRVRRARCQLNIVAPKNGGGGCDLRSGEPVGELLVELEPDLDRTSSSSMGVEVSLARTSNLRGPPGVSRSGHVQIESNRPDLE